MYIVCVCARVCVASPQHTHIGFLPFAECPRCYGCYGCYGCYAGRKAPSVESKILGLIERYVVTFFGCEYCVEHFKQEIRSQEWWCVLHSAWHPVHPTALREYACGGCGCGCGGGGVKCCVVCSGVWCGDQAAPSPLQLIAVDRGTLVVAVATLHLPLGHRR